MAEWTPPHYHGDNINIEGITIEPMKNQEPLIPTEKIAYLQKLPQPAHSIGAIPTTYLESLSYEQTLFWLCKYLEETVIPALNQNSLAVQQLRELFIKLCIYYNELKDYTSDTFNQLVNYINNSLKTITDFINNSNENMTEFINQTIDDMKQYIDDCFTDLNVQDEINNKLDQMKEDGSLADIINNQIFNQLNDKIDNYNFTNVKTLGAKGDGVTDDTEIIKTAIQNYNSLYFPNGTYIINETLTINKDFALHGESTNVILNTGNNTEIILDVSNSDNIYMVNFNTTNAKFKIYPSITSSEKLPQVMKNKNFFLQNVISDGLSQTNWNLFISTPKPDNYDRDFHTGLYPRYPIEIFNHSGYNAINIENWLENDDGSIATVQDNSAIGIVDKCLSSAPTLFIAMHGERNAVNIKNKTNTSSPSSTSNPNSVFQVGYNGHLSIGCSVYNEEGANGVGTIKLKDNSPSIRFYDTNNTAIQMIRSQNKHLQFIANGALAAYFDNNQKLNLLKPLITALEHAGNITFKSSFAGGSDFHLFIDDKGILKINRTVSGVEQNTNAGYSVLTNRNGTTAQRPTSQLTNDWQSIGYQYFDTTLNKPIWWNGTTWVDATGARV